MTKDPQEIQNHLDDISMMNVDFHSVAFAARQLFLAHGPSLNEDIKYGGLVYLRDGKIVGGIYVYKDHISIEFSNGATFEDPGALLQGKGKARRHLKLVHKNELEEQKAEFYIKQACAA